jgi:hypothetical protein
MFQPGTGRNLLGQLRTQLLDETLRVRQGREHFRSRGVRRRRHDRRFALHGPLDNQAVD